MRLVTSHQGVLQEIARAQGGSLLLREAMPGTGGTAGGAAVGGGGKGDRVLSGVGAWDEAAPGGGFARRAVHELLFETGGRSAGWGGPWLLAAVLARAACGGGVGGGKVVWVDPEGEVFAPALVSAGVPLESLVLLRAKSVKEQLWGIAECLRCPAVGVVVASPPALSRLWARRMQLAAERGGGMGVFLRDRSRASIYAAATRWWVRPEPVVEETGWGVGGGVGVGVGVGQRQRWRVELLHGIGRSADGGGGGIVVEVSHETGDVRSVAAVAAGEKASSEVVGRRVRQA